MFHQLVAADRVVALADREGIAQFLTPDLFLPKIGISK